MALYKKVVLIMMNKCVKFERSSLNIVEVMTKVKVFHANATDDNNNADDDTGVVTIPQLFFFEKNS